MWWLSERLERIERKMDRALDLLNRVRQKEGIMSKELDDLTAQVKSNNDLLDSATTLINGIAARIDAAGGDPTKLAALSAELKSKDDTLAAAVAANTPAAP